LDCASTEAPLTDCYNHNNGVNNVIPTDMFVPGCACRPEATIDAVVLAIGKWQQSLRALQRNMDRNRITR